MQTRNTRQKWITAYRIITLALLAIILVFQIGGIVTRDQQLVITSSQADRVAQTAAFLETVGFNDPVYLGITPGAEGEYPTFEATAIGGERVELWIRTVRNGGLEIQPVGVWESVHSADDFARMASDAVYRWENLPDDVQPRTDGSYGEYESTEYRFDLLSPYDPDDSYWDSPRDETSGWPSD